MRIFFLVLVAVLGWCMEFTNCQDLELDGGTGPSLEQNHPRQHRRHPKFHAIETEDEFDIENTHNVTTSHYTESSHPKGDYGTQHSRENKGKKGLRRGGEEAKSKKAKRRKAAKDKQVQQERRWYHCSDGRDPKDVKDLAETDQPGMGHMCGGLYPDSTCCYDHDLTMELVGDKILEQIPDLQCAKMLMKLRCAHCSPRSWWLFHAPDKVRYPHKRMMPIMCPSFCRKFHRLCRDYVGGLQDDNFCNYHTTNEEGPCFPDSFMRRGTID